MGTKDKNIVDTVELRNRAENRLLTNAPEVGLYRTDREMRRLIHELEVHQIEMEMQNAELQQSRNDADMSLEKYTDLYEFAPVSYFTLDSKGIINAVNIRGASLVGVARPRLLGQRFSLFVTDEYRRIFADFLDAVFLHQDKSVCEVALENEGNKRIYVLLKAMATISGQECALAVIDLTERRLAEESLQASELKFRSYIDNAPDAVLIVDENDRYLEVNYSAIRITGYSEDELLSMSIYDLLPQESVGNALSKTQSLKDTGQMSDEREIILKNGTHRWWSVDAVKLSETRYLRFCKDITEHKQAEDDLRCYARRLIEMEEKLRIKLATELHDEISRDLTVLGINMAIIGAGIKDVVPKKLTARVKDSGKLIKSISHTVRSIMAGLRPPALDDFGLLASLRWHAELFSKRNGIVVTVQAEEPFPRLTIEKEIALFRIAQEALMNVSKHAATERVTIKLRITEGLVRLTVADEGDGFLPTSSSLNPGGSGWGMTIMRERAELNGGKFQVDSAPGKGTTISVVMPLEDI